ncbi:MULTISPECIES: cobaltochelatase subunit CobN [unclassified Tolypothrix]|uniref:cobaltochelatase subunit CobN n=2 Tax=Tolypothrix TaxID=111782 RepID=UPI0005EABA39|nr:MULTISPECIES: cobaltochelatase subunit CobN [unclassified Tolypothrix]EKE98732.1 cobaltochelatase, CobN subunit [Tolypothrix sp. PCC 7601]UYD24249.1 cobaltochelatase subunit CobN [Tolypothrix sp. PCC 7712]UYD33521.1 cobaltochelatase subunit CobN [Tolypothrix sp. PCC 7601]BAY90025.1 cobaltochelatase subunit CobN [Microchaete diplosiphon NIES-3275]
MHRVSATSGGWNQSEDLIFIEQTPAPFVFITAADTDIQTLAAAVPQLPATFPALRVANLLQLQQQISIDSYGEEVLELAQVIIVRLLGGRSYWAYGLEVVQEIVQSNGINLIVMPGDDAFDPHLVSQSSVPLDIVNQVWQYFSQGGVKNFVHALQFIADSCLSTSFNPPAPELVPRIGLYEWGLGTGDWGLGTGDEGERSDAQCPMPNAPCPMSHAQCPMPKVGILFYRAHYLSGNTRVIDSLCQALVQKNLQPVPVFVSSLREPDIQEELSEFFQPKDSEQIAVLLNTTSFSLARLETETPQIELWEKLDVPVLQVILSGGRVEQWESQMTGLSPRDIAMNVALPEVDGRIISRAVSFKTVQTRNQDLETDVVVYEPISDRIEFVAQLAANWVRLRSKPPQERRIAVIVANYPNRDGRLANGVGLDTPASCVEILKALQLAGYHLENLPANSDELIQRLTTGVTNDPEGRDWRAVNQSLSLEEYQNYFATLPSAVQQGITQRWGDWGLGTGDWVLGIGDKADEGETKHIPLPITNYQLPITNYPMPNAQCPMPIPGIQLGNIFVGIQPSRGYDLDPSLNYHAPDLEPTHNYLAFYYWVKECFGADAIVHVGKHGNLEWLPGKSLALSSNCYPEVALGAMPHLYPFIVNDPGEGSQAKRRSQAVIIDHLTPPMTRAELYGSLQQLENLIDEYYEAESLDPVRLPMIRDRIRELMLQENLHQDLGITNEQDILNFENLILNSINGYLCELKEAQIRDGLHIFGQCPQGQQLRDLIVAIARIPNRYSIGITRALAAEWSLDFDPLTANFSDKFTLPESSLAPLHLVAKLKSCHTIGDAVEILEEHAAYLVEQLIASNPQYPVPSTQSPVPPILHWIALKLLPALQQTQQEITNLLRGLDGRYVQSAASGAPTRGRPEVLPTGKNFYSVDIRALPTETAWDIGRKAAETLVERYTQDNGEYPKTLALSVWGTATMRTGGDDIAEALALLGVRPVWDGAARRVVDFEILPLSVLGRPRVDVTLRISGFFRDAFPNMIDLFDSAVQAVAALDEPPEQNPLAAQVQQDTDFWQAKGLTSEEAQMRSRYRIFGSKPGAYGAGLQGLMESQNWTDDQDLARAYINWSSYAYSPSSPTAAPEALQQRLMQTQVVLHNQDNREHDLLDSDDYYQFQGGLTAAVRSLQGQNPQIYFGDNSNTAQPKVRQLKEEIARVYRSRVINPKWIAGVMRHGYKGAFEMAATVDFLFAYDATTQCVEDYMYQGIVNTYLLDPAVEEFIQQKNPWALRDIAEKLLEAHKRSLWQDVNTQTLEMLRALVHQAEAAIEEK